MTVPAFVLFNALLLCAAISDLRAFRIPNPLSALVAVAGVVVHPPTNLAEALARLASFAVVALIGGVMWGRRMIGGGDLKLLAACAVWIPFATLGAFVIWVGWLGAFQGLATLVLFRWNPGWLQRSGSARAHLQVPYAVSIAGAGFLWSLPQVIG